jgi:hypothetical protein
MSKISTSLQLGREVATIGFFLCDLCALAGNPIMRIIHKCPAGQGSGSASPKGQARALAPSLSYRFVKNSHGLPITGRRPQIFPEISSCLCKVGRAKSPQSSVRNSGEAAGEIILRLAVNFF